jgi:hypothetical protein
MHDEYERKRPIPVRIPNTTVQRELGRIKGPILVPGVRLVSERDELGRVYRFRREGYPIAVLRPVGVIPVSVCQRPYAVRSRRGGTGTRKELLGEHGFVIAHVKVECPPTAYDRGDERCPKKRLEARKVHVAYPTLEGLSPRGQTRTTTSKSNSRCLGPHLAILAPVALTYSRPSTASSFSPGLDASEPFGDNPKPTNNAHAWSFQHSSPR